MGIVRLLAVALLMMVLASAASAQRSLQSVGYRQIEMPYPDGYVATSMYYPDVVRTFQTRMPPQIALLEVYVTQDDFAKLQAKQAPSFERMMQLHLLRAAEDKAVSAEGFEEMTSELEASLKKTGGADLAATPRRDATGLHYAVNAGPSYVANLLINANFQPLSLVAYVPAGEAAAAEAALTRWAQAIKADNPDKGQFRERAGRIDISSITGGSSSGGDPSEDGAYRFGYWLGIAFFLFIIYRVFIRKRS